MDNSFDKLNGEFAEKKQSGGKYWFLIVLGFALAVIGVGVGIYSLMTNKYFSLLTLLAGLFGTQAVMKAKNGAEWNKVIKVDFILNMVVVGLACIVLYIVPMFE